MGFALLTEIVFRHRFFADNSFRNINVLLPQQTAIEMRRYGLLFRRMPDRIVVLLNADNSDRTRLLQEGVTLFFDVQLLDRYFYNYTALRQTDVPGTILLFSNQRECAPGKLHRQESASADDLIPAESEGAGISARPFARIIMSLTPELLPVYEISFAAKATKWCYFLMSNDLSLLTQPSIVDARGSIQFAAPLPVDMPDGRRVPVLISQQVLPLSQRPVHTLQLRDTVGEGEQYRTIIQALPSPDITAVSAAGMAIYDRTVAYSEIFLY
ncbi:hypothetical protein [Chitinophaga rhizophila]|uniref:Uncharacterized protein n=1 Tax=Chitinophaga rhizophila TaxID=2866212 RepID=A0ABS7GHU1_9BACT|nr:hypothetical protein [Chitinophaga rhizophila]MBW8686805.1 hypothetical protein [Chitinophaga rhizophila]